MMSEDQDVEGTWRRLISRARSLVRAGGRHDVIMAPIQVQDTAIVGSPHGENSSAPPPPAAILVVGSSTFTFNEFVNCMNFTTNRQQRFLPLEDVSNTGDRQGQQQEDSVHLYYSSDHTHNEGLTFSLAIDGERVDQTYPWHEGGFCLYLMTTGPLSEEFDGKRVNIETDISGSYHFPTNSKLISAIYNIKASFFMRAKLELEHCFSGDLSTLAFVYCESSHPPYLHLKRTMNIPSRPHMG